MSSLVSLLAQQQDQPTPDEQTAALLSALRGQQGMGQLLQLSGDKVLAPFGQNLDAGAQQQAGELQQATGGRLKLALEAKKTAQENALKQREIQQTGAYQQGELGLGRQALEMGKFAVNATTGQIYDTRTGQPVSGTGAPGASKFTRLPDPDEKTLDAVLNGIAATDTVKKARSGGLFGQPAYAATLSANVPAIAAAESGSGRASSQGEIADRAPNYVSPSGDTFFDQTRAELIKDAQAKIAGHKQRGYDVSAQEARLNALAGAGSSAATAPTAHPQDSIAMQWAKANPKDPRAAKILALNGG